eukprot:2141263-Amphidinium_carterae.2
MQWVTEALKSSKTSCGYFTSERELPVVDHFVVQCHGESSGVTYDAYKSTHSKVQARAEHRAYVNHHYMYSFPSMMITIRVNGTVTMANIGHVSYVSTKTISKGKTISQATGLKYAHTTSPG